MPGVVIWLARVGPVTNQRTARNCPFCRTGSSCPPEICVWSRRLASTDRLPTYTLNDFLAALKRLGRPRFPQKAWHQALTEADANDLQRLLNALARQFERTPTVQYVDRIYACALPQMNGHVLHWQAEDAHSCRLLAGRKCEKSKPTPWYSHGLFVRSHFLSLPLRVAPTNSRTLEDANPRARAEGRWNRMRCVHGQKKIYRSRATAPSGLGRFVGIECTGRRYIIGKAY